MIHARFCARRNPLSQKKYGLPLTNVGCMALASKAIGLSGGAPGIDLNLWRNILIDFVPPPNGHSFSPWLKFITWMDTKLSYHLPIQAIFPNLKGRNTRRLRRFKFENIWALLPLHEDCHSIINTAWVAPMMGLASRPLRWNDMLFL